MASFFQRAVALATIACIAGRAVGFTCYDTSALAIADRGLRLEAVQVADPSVMYAACITYTYSAMATWNGVGTLFANNAVDGEGINATCDRVTGSYTPAAIADITKKLAEVFAKIGDPSSVKVTGLRCCNFANCNTGLGYALTIVAANASNLPIVNMLVVLLASLVGYFFTTKMI